MNLHATAAIRLRTISYIRVRSWSSDTSLLYILETATARWWRCNNGTLFCYKKRLFANQTRERQHRYYFFNKRGLKRLGVAREDDLQKIIGDINACTDFKMF
jgi:hypothetical protein